MNSCANFPTANSFKIVARDGERFRVEYAADGNRVSWLVSDSSGREIGRAITTICDQVLHIDDIWIHDKLSLPMPNLPLACDKQPLLERLSNLPKPHEKVSYQKRGIGTELLKLIIRSARHAKCRAVAGELTFSNCERFPGLPNWYRKRGFTAIALGKSDVRFCYRIVLNLHPI